eukprot:2191595-Pyramimonas_sp.AAC.1
MEQLRVGWWGGPPRTPHPAKIFTPEPSGSSARESARRGAGPGATEGALRASAAAEARAQR